MEHEPIKYPEDVEDGEISDSDEGYTPLSRPDPEASRAPTEQTSTSDILKMEEASDKDDSLAEASTSDDSDSDAGPRGKSMKSKLRLKPIAALTPVVPKIKKNNIWASGLQEESLMENLKGCGVDQQSTNYDRSVESYDYSIKYRLNDGDQNALKRRLSTNSDSSANDNNKPFACFGNHQKQSKTKRFRANSMGSGSAGSKRNVRLRLGVVKGGEDSSSNDGTSQHLNAPRTIIDLIEITDKTSNEEIARDMANKLYEEKDELLLKIVNVLGSKLPLEVFRETQKIESLGGMLIMNGQRRRTPGGVFFFLLKNSADLQHEHKKQIFYEESKKQNKEQKILQAKKRDRKVEELKMSLKMENDLTVLSTRGDLVVNRAKEEPQNNLSNPPPSPVTDGNRENSSDFDANIIQHVNVTSPEKPGNSSKDTVAGSSFETVSNLRLAAESAQLNQQLRAQQLQNQTQTQAAASYQDDFLDMHCDDMDMF